VISSPSGGGKTTLTRKAIEALPGLVFSVSYTTRPQRTGESDGRDYHFVDEATFDRMVAADAFLEWAPVHGCRYGTARRETEEALVGGQDLMLDIDVQGSRQLRESGFEGAVYVFVLPPDYATLRERLTARGRERGEEVERRLSVAAREVAEFESYDYLIVNDDLSRSIEELVSIVRSERRRIRRCRAEAETIMATIPPAAPDGSAAERR
jgi:guanylate kinase